MSIHYTQFYTEDKSVSDTHYTFGSKILMTNIDCIEYCYASGKRKRIAMIDYKHFGYKPLTTQPDAIKAQGDLALDLNLPFFFAITYLDPKDYRVPMYFVLPVNKLAVQTLEQIEGKWYTVKQYALWQYKLRNLQPTESDYEKINLLSDQFKMYELPDIQELEVLP